MKSHVARAPQGPKYLRPLNQKQINQQASKQLAAQMAAAKAPILSAQQFEAKRQAAAQQAMAGFGTAAMGMYTPPGQVQQAYKDAAQETAGLAAGFAGQEGKDITAAEQANNAFAQQQAPGSAPEAAPTGEATQNASYYLGGYNPGASLESQGAAAAATAAGLPMLQGARTEQDMQSLIAHGAENDQKYVQDMLDLAAKAPDMRNQIMDHLYAREQQKGQLRIQQQAQNLYQQKFGVQTKQENRRLNQADKRMRIAERQGNARLALSAGNLRLAQQRQHTAVRQALKDGQRIDASASHAAGYLVNKNGQPILDSKGGHIPVHATSSSSGSGNGVNSTGYHQAVRASKTVTPEPKVAQGANAVLYKYYAKPNQGTFVPGEGWFTNDESQAVSTGKYMIGDRAYTFPGAVNYMVNAYGISRKAARKALIAGGVTPNGKRPGKKS